MKICRIIMFLFAGIYWISVRSQPSAGYYDRADGLSGKPLQQALHGIIDNHRIIPYDSLYICFRKTDVKNDSIVWDMYSDKPGNSPAYLYFYGKGRECGNYNSEADCYNREHSFPKSWFADMPPMNTDLFHIYPTDGYVNNRRANYPFGETGTATWTSTNGSRVGPCSWPGYMGIVFEPVDEYKGDFARTYFYMATRYFGEDASWPGSDMVTGAEPKSWAGKMLIAWHRNDTVSAKEISRNNEVFNFQGNRNPFIDQPLFAEKIWGMLNLTGEYGWKEKELVIYPNPASDFIHLRFNNQSFISREILIYNISGILHFQTRTEKEITAINVDHFLPGLYIVRIVCVYGTYTGSFVKVAD